MRISTKLIFNTVVNNLQRNAGKLLDSQEALSSGKKISSPSDDPVGFAKALDYKSVLNNAEQYSRNIDSGVSFLNLSDSVLDNVNKTLLRAKELAVAMANDSLTSEERANAAEEVTNLLGSLVQLSNTKLGDRYIYAGFINNSPPFDSAGDYSGDSGDIQIEIGTNVRESINLPGDEIFKGSVGGVDIFDIVSDFETSLEGNDIDGIRSAIDELDNAINQINDKRAIIGARVNRLENTKNSINTFKVHISEFKSNVEDADITKVVTDMVLQQQILQASQSSAAQIISTSLLNFLR